MFRFRTKAKRVVRYERKVLIGVAEYTGVPAAGIPARRREVWRSPIALLDWISEFDDDDGYVKLRRDDYDLCTVLVKLGVCTPGPQGPSGTPFGSSKAGNFEEFRAAVDRATKAVERKARALEREWEG
jgi:hypothetical protein